MFRFLVGFALFVVATMPSVAAERILKVPAGFEVQKIAGPPLVGFPVSGTFDDKGRLYVTEMAGPITREEVGQQKPLHRIVRLEDTNGDGVFDKSMLFADQLPFPEGILWHQGSIYSACPPKIWKFTDTNNDGKADRRDVWFDGKTITGCANDLHGPYLGPDGYIYWAKGAFAKQDYVLAGGKPFSTRASHIFRAKPDGSNLEPVMTGGMDNPVDVVFMPNGDRLFTTTFFQHPADGKRDGIIHAIYGGIYGKDHDVIHDPVHKWTSPQLMPVLTHMGPAAPCGLHRYTSNHLGNEFRDNVFACQFNLHRVSRHILTPRGSTYETQDSAFVTSDDFDFHPTDVFEDDKGGLIIIDTGGWYKLCCPSSQLVKDDVYGGIYRVRKMGAPDSKPRQAEPLPELYTIGLNRDRAGLSKAISALKDTNLHTRRQAAEALGRMGDAKAVPAILKALDDSQNDRALDHALTYALIEIADPEATRVGLSSSARVLRATMMALEQMPEGKVPADRVLAALVGNENVRSTALWVARRHPEWGNELAAYFQKRLETRPSSATEQESLAQTLIPFLGWEPVQGMLAELLLKPSRNQSKTFVYDLMRRSGLKSMPAVWAEALTKELQKPEQRELALQVARALPAPAKVSENYRNALESVVRNPQPGSESQSMLAICALPGESMRLKEELLTRIISCLQRDRSAEERTLAVDALGKVALTPEQLTRVSAAIPTMSPTEVPRLLDLFAKRKEESVGHNLVKTLNTPAVRASLRVELVKPLFDKFPASVRDEANKLYSELEKARAGERQRLDALALELPSGDIRRGQLVFNSAKAACITCHKIGYVGGTLGPDLTRIGGIRTEKDLLDSIIYPSAAIVRGYEPVKVTTKDGAVHMGILKKDAPDEVVLVIAAEKEVRVSRGDVEEMSPGAVSVMPGGLDQQLSKQELADLIAFLRASR